MVIALVEEGNLPLQKVAECKAFLIELRGGGSNGIWYVGKLVGALVRDFGVCHPKLRTVVDEAQENPFLNFVQLRRNTAFPGYPGTVRTA
jgi:hypothetical protein